MDKRKKAIPVLAGVVISVGSYFGYDNYFYIHSDNANIETRTLLIASKVSGYLTDVKVDIGDRVKEGDLLAKIDDRDYDAALERAKADLESTDVRLQDAQKNHDRVASLFHKGATTQAQYDNALAGLNELKARHQSMKAQVALAQLNMDHTEIKAPFDGAIAKRAAEIGQLVGTATPLFGFVDANERWIIANLKETEISSIKPGSKVDIKVDAISGRKFSGKVLQLSPSTGASFTLIPPDNATGNFTKVVQRVPMKISIDGLVESDLQLLRAGLSADVRIHKSL